MTVWAYHTIGILYLIKQVDNPFIQRVSPCVLKWQVPHAAVVAVMFLARINRAFVYTRLRYVTKFCLVVNAPTAKVSFLSEWNVRRVGAEVAWASLHSAGVIVLTVDKGTLVCARSIKKKRKKSFNREFWATVMVTSSYNTLWSENTLQISPFINC